MGLKKVSEVIAMWSYAEMAFAKEMVGLLRKMPKPQPDVDHCVGRRSNSMVLANQVADILKQATLNKIYEDTDQKLLLVRREMIRNLRSVSCPCVWETYLGEYALASADAIAILLEGLWMCRVI